MGCFVLILLVNVFGLTCFICFVVYWIMLIAANVYWLIVELESSLLLWLLLDYGLIILVVCVFCLCVFAYCWFGIGLWVYLSDVYYDTVWVICFANLCCLGFKFECCFVGFSVWFLGFVVYVVWWCLGFVFGVFTLSLFVCLNFGGFGFWLLYLCWIYRLIAFDFDLAN